MPAISTAASKRCGHVGPASHPLPRHGAAFRAVFRGPLEQGAGRIGHASASSRAGAVQPAVDSLAGPAAVGRVVDGGETRHRHCARMLALRPVCSSGCAKQLPLVFWAHDDHAGRHWLERGPAPAARFHRGQQPLYAIHSANPVSGCSQRGAVLSGALPRSPSTVPSSDNRFARPCKRLRMPQSSFKPAAWMLEGAQVPLQARPASRNCRTGGAGSLAVLNGPMRPLI